MTKTVLNPGVIPLLVSNLEPSEFCTAEMVQLHTMRWAVEEGIKIVNLK